MIITWEIFEQVSVTEFFICCQLTRQVLLCWVFNGVSFVCCYFYVKLLELELSWKKIKVLYYHSCSYCSREVPILRCFRLLSLAKCLNCLLAWQSYHLDSQSGTLLLTPAMCLAFMTNWCLAAMRAISLNASCSSWSLATHILWASDRTSCAAVRVFPVFVWGLCRFWSCAFHLRPDVQTWFV